ncbi:hypothetical protein ABPG75_008144 [Micractinium tetrahymenae]
MAPAHSKLKAKANYFGGEPIIVERQYVQGMTAALGQFGFIGIAAIYHAHPSLKGIHSPEGSTGWRVSIQIELPCGKKKVVHTAIFHSDYEAAVMLEMCRLWRRKFNKNYGGKNNDAVIQVARDDAAASLPDDADTWELLHDYQEDTFVSDLSWGAVPMRGVCTQPNLYQGRGGYVAFFSGSVNGVRQRQHLGNWPKHTEDGLRLAGIAWDKAAHAAGYRNARLNFKGEFLDE